MRSKSKPTELTCEIVPAHAPSMIPIVRRMFEEYAAALGIDLCFQGFQQELLDLPGRYAPPDGCLLLAVATSDHGDTDGNIDNPSAESIAGCVAYRTIDHGVCEMKRLYVRPAFRGRGIGRALVEKLLECARRNGLQKMVLDTLDSMTAAVSLYHGFGFTETPPYSYHPVPGTLCLELNLREPNGKADSSSDHGGTNPCR